MLYYLTKYFRRRRSKSFDLKNEFTSLYLMDKKHNWSAFIPCSEPNWVEQDFKNIKKKLEQGSELTEESRKKIILKNEVIYEERRQVISGIKIQLTFMSLQGKIFLNDAWVVMVDNNNIIDVFRQKNWKELIYYTPSKIVRALSYEEAYTAAYYTFLSDFRDESLQKLAQKLLFSIREIYPERWKEDWKNEVFLGGVCEWNCQYDDRYDAYFRAYNLASLPPPSLLILLAECNSCPGVPPVSKEEAKQLLKEAIKLEKSYEAFHALYLLYKEDNFQEAAHWKILAEEAKQNGLQTAKIIPDIIKNFNSNFFSTLQNFSNFEEIKDNVKI